MAKYISNHKNMLRRSLRKAEEEYSRTSHDFAGGRVNIDVLRDAWTNLRWQYNKNYHFDRENLIVLDGHDGDPPTYHRMTPQQIKKAAYDRTRSSSPVAGVYQRQWEDLDFDFNRLVAAASAQPE